VIKILWHITSVEFKFLSGLAFQKSRFDRDRDGGDKREGGGLLLVFLGCCLSVNMSFGRLSKYYTLSGIFDIE